MYPTVCGIQYYVVARKISLSVVGYDWRLSVCTYILVSFDIMIAMNVGCPTVYVSASPYESQTIDYGRTT